ncbi:MAG: nitrogen fixation protein NifH [Dehalococcoidia bacterium]|nr:MAG: nitrogen fixation protein NifH [Dehalococcoidia bacterium]
MKDWKTILKHDPTNWLLEKDNPSVRYWTLRKLGGLKDDAKLDQEKTAIMQSDIIKTIMANQGADGYWAGGPDIYLPKYRASTHQLKILAEMGATINLGIKKGIERIFDSQLDSGHFATKPPKTARGRASKLVDGICLTGNVLYYLIHFGYLEDARTQRAIQFVVETHTKECGWMCRAYPIDKNRVYPENCFMGSIKPLIAFSMIPQKKRSSKMNEIIKKNIEMVLENKVFMYLRDKYNKRKAKYGWTRFGFPLFYNSDILEILGLLTDLGIKDPRTKEAIDVVLNHQLNDGKWLLHHSFNGKMYKDIEEKGKPSKWITLRALYALKGQLSSG